MMRLSGRDSRTRLYNVAIKTGNGTVYGFKRATPSEMMRLAGKIASEQGAEVKWRKL